MHANRKHIKSKSSKRAIIAIFFIFIIFIMWAAGFDMANANSNFEWLIMIIVGSFIWMTWGLCMWLDLPKNRIKKRSKIKRLISISSYKKFIVKNILEEDLSEKSMYENVSNIQVELYNYLLYCKNTQLVCVEEERWFLNKYLNLNFDRNNVSLIDVAEHDYDDLRIVPYVFYPIVHYFCQELKRDEYRLKFKLDNSDGFLVLSINSNMQLNVILFKLEEQIMQYHAHFTDEHIEFYATDNFYKICIPMLA